MHTLSLVEAGGGTLAPFPVVSWPDNLVPVALCSLPFVCAVVHQCRYAGGGLAKLASRLPVRVAVQA
jgi:hypothetical protein